MKSYSHFKYFRIVFISYIFLNIFSLFLNHYAYGFERFSSYVTELYLDPPIIEVTKNIEIENYGTVGIVPGELVFRILDVGKDQIMNVSAKDEFGNIFPTSVREGQGFVEILVEDYIPVFAKSKQKITVKYTIKIKTKSLLFYTFEYPLIDTTLPIKYGKLVLKTPKYLHITYAPGIKCENNECFWEFENTKKKSVVFEISYVPLPRLKVPGVNVFWYGIISLITLIIIIQFLIRKFSSRHRRYF